MAKYEFDKESFDIKKVSRSFSNIIWRVIKWIVVSASFAIVYYVIASLFISTPEERRLRRENKMYEKLYDLVPDKHLPVIAMGHLQATGSEISENDRSERTVIGGLECVSPDAFGPGITYTEVNDVHYWKAEYTDEKNHQPLACKF